jgi:glycosyltransferase involved in cell wall biosynthesis
MANTKRKKLKIAQIAPLIERVPPKKYGGTERVIHTLTEELVKRGHKVTLFATGDSKTSAELVSVYPRSLREAKLKDMYGANELTMLNVGTAFKRQDKFDIIHDHSWTFSLPTSAIATTPVVTTLHGPFTRMNRRLFRELPGTEIVTISKAQENLARGVKVAGTVYNGLPLEDYPYSEEREDFLLFVGRISPEKGVHHAIEVADELDLPLIIAAKLESVDVPYFNQYIAPKLSDDRIKWIGEVNEQERNDLMSRARCFLHPATWPEPFGLTLIESMACGCPVVAFRKGSISEIVENGVTGYVVDDTEDMVDAVENIKSIDGAKCRSSVLERFNPEQMADGYENIYYKTIAKRERKQKSLDQKTKSDFSQSSLISGRYEKQK